MEFSTTLNVYSYLLLRLLIQHVFQNLIWFVSLVGQHCYLLCVSAMFLGSSYVLAMNAGAAQCLGELYRLFGKKITSGLLGTTSIVTKLMKFSEVVLETISSSLALVYIL